MPRAVPRSGRELISADVSVGRYFFIDLSPHPSGPVQVAFGGREYCDEHYNVQRTTYPFVTLEYVAEGEGEFRVGTGEPQALRPGTVFVHGPGLALRMATKAGRSMLKYFVCFTGRAAQANVSARVAAYGTTLTLSRHGDVRDMFDLLIREGEEQTRHVREIGDRVGELLLLKIAAARGEMTGNRSSSGRERFLRCKTLIDEESGRFSSLEQIAAAVGAEPSGLNRLFRRYQGVSPYQYLLRRKMNQAAQDFIRHNALVKEVAARAGYPDPFHFSRLFKAVHGISPAHFRQLYCSETGD